MRSFELIVIHWNSFIELWFDGKQQTLNKNSTRYAARTLDAGHCDPKWGVYGGDDGDHTTFVAEPKIGTTLEDVTPQWVLINN